MVKINRKLRCRHPVWIKFGGRKRRCQVCGSIWRVYRHKRGRKKKIRTKILERYLGGGLPSLTYYAQKRKKNTRSLSYILEKQRDLFIKRIPWPEVPEGPIILVADAFLHQIRGVMYTTYLILARPVDGEKAVILPPYIAPGKEKITEWYKALNILPLDVHRRVKALVSDGHRGTVNYAKGSNWIRQRCVFHLLSAMQGRRSRRKYSCHRDEGKLIYELTKMALVEKDEDKLFKILSELENLGWQTRSNQLKKIISGFIKAKDDYRSWMKYPELKLPDTSNSMESFISFFEKFHSRSRGFRSLDSLTKWIIAVLKFHREIFCRPKKEKQPN